MQKKGLKRKSAPTKKRKTSSSSTKEFSPRMKPQVTAKQRQKNTNIQIACWIAFVALLLLCYFKLGLTFTLVTALGIGIILGITHLLRKVENNKKKKDEDNSLYEDVGLFSSLQAKSSIDNEPDDCSPTNAGSIILLFEPIAGRRFLLFGDANRAAIADAVSNSANLTGCTIKVPHHGSKHNLTSALIDELAPNCAIISAKGTQKHPSRGIVHCLSKHCNVYSTHKSGNLIHTSYPVNNPAIPLKKKQ